MPAGYAAVARDVRISRGGEIAYAALRMALGETAAGTIHALCR